MANLLTFTETRSINNFKASKGIERINLIKNPKTNKTFFASPDDSTVSGKVSEKFDATKPIMISVTADSVTGESFYMLHNEGAQANVIASL